MFYYIILYLQARSYSILFNTIISRTYCTEYDMQFEIIIKSKSEVASNSKPYS